MSERLPQPDGPRIRDTAIGADDRLVLAAGTRLVRVHALAGAHPLGWNELRAFGPTASRFDHHPRPRRLHPTRRIAYLAHGEDALVTALAEYFQGGGGSVHPFDLRHRRPAATLLVLAGALDLLDLDGGWVTRAGGNQAIRTGPRGVARDWARAIHRHHPTIGGLAYGSSVWGPGRCVALWERGEACLPAAPAAHRMLDDPAMAPAIAAVAERLGTSVL